MVKQPCESTIHAFQNCLDLPLKCFTEKRQLGTSKKQSLCAARGIVTFEDCVVVLETGKILDVAPNQSSNQKAQRMFFKHQKLCLLRSLAESGTEIFLEQSFRTANLLHSI